MALIYIGHRHACQAGIQVQSFRMGAANVGGYGSSSIYHTEKILRLSQDLPIVVEVVEFTERIERILPQLDGMIGGGLVTLEKVRVILYRSSK